MLLPELLPDETFYSLLARIALMNGTCDYVSMIQFLMGGRRSSQMRLAHFCEVTHGTYGSPRDVMRRLTPLDVLIHLSELTASEFGKIECGGAITSLAEFAFGDRPHWRVCKECMGNDIRTYGIAYWHRAHQLPLSNYCVLHAQPLFEWKIERSHLHDHFYLPAQLCTKQLTMSEIPFEFREAWFDVSCIGSAALSDNSAPLSSASIRATFLSGLTEKGLLKKNGRARSSDFVEFMVDEYGLLHLDSIRSGIGTLVTPKQLLSGLLDGSPCKPFGRLLLVRSLFGCWDSFKLKCQWQDVMRLDGLFDDAHHSSWASARALKLGSVATARYRQVCMEYMTLHPDATRLDFLKQEYRAFRWLRNHDQAWFDARLPVPPRFGKQLDLFD